MAQQQRAQVRTSQSEPGLEHRLRTFKAMQLIWLGLGILEALIGLRVIFKLIAVDPGNILASLLYGLTNVFLFPFSGLIPTPTSGGNVLELSSLVAMVIYALLAWAAVKLVEVIFYRPRGAVVSVTESTSSEEHTP